MATLLDIAERTGVSKSTISRALRGDRTLSIADSTRERIFAAAKELGYETKREKKMKKMQKIAVIHKDTHFLNQVDNAYYFSVRYGIETVCRERGVHYSFLPITFLDQLEKDLDGVVICGNFVAEEMKKIVACVRKLPMVFLGQTNFCPGETDWVTYEVEDAVTMAMDCLRNTGHRRILYLGRLDIEGTPERNSKLFCFHEYLRRHPEMELAGVVEGEHGVTNGRAMMEQWLAGNSILPDALFVTNDPIAIGALQVLQERHIEVPSQISVISINGDCTASAVSPPLTTVDVHTEEMGRLTVELLLERLQGSRTTLKKVVLYPALQPGGSIRGLETGQSTVSEKN